MEGVNQYVKHKWDQVYSPVEFAEDPPNNPTKVAFYPLKAIWYFLVNPRLWLIVLCPIIITLMVSIVSFVIVFGGFLYPQYLLIYGELWDISWLAWILAVILCLAEWLLIIGICVVIFFDGTKKRIYKQVFIIESVKISRANLGLLAKEEQTTSCCCWMCEDMVSSVVDCFCCCFSPTHYWKYVWYKTVTWIIFVISMPLNLIPGLGTAVFCLLNGSFLAWRLQISYFQEKEIPPNVARYIFTHRYSEYLAFGTVCVVLDLIPFLNVFFIYTNIIATALWIIDMESQGIFNQTVAVSLETLSDGENPFTVRRKEDETPSILFFEE